MSIIELNGDKLSFIYECEWRTADGEWKSAWFADRESAHRYMGQHTSIEDVRFINKVSVADFMHSEIF